LQHFIRQATCLDQVAYGASKFDRHQTSLATHAVTQYSLSPMGMEGMEIGHVLLFFSFEYRRKTFPCALINWFVHTDGHDPDTQMWTVKPEFDRRGEPTLEVIHLDSIARAAHLLPVYGQLHVPEDFDYHTALDSFNSFFVNHYIDHHAHEFIGTD
jgi:hypothetical protein